MKRRIFIKTIAALASPSLIKPIYSRQSFKQLPIYEQLYRKAEPLSTASPDSSKKIRKILKRNVDNNTTVGIIFTDDSEIPGKPVSAQISVHCPNGESLIIRDQHMDGFKPEEQDYFNIDAAVKIDMFISIRKSYDDLPQKLIRYLEQLNVYADNPNGTIENILPGDVGIQFPDVIPFQGAYYWDPIDKGMDTASFDIIFHGKLFDRMRLVRIDPQYYRFSIHNDPTLRTIERWQKDLDALAVINGGFYTNDPYGYPLTPIKNDDIIKGIHPWNTANKGNGLFIAEPDDPLQPGVQLKALGNDTVVDLSTIPYKVAAVNYPTLLNQDQKDIAPHLLKKERRACRTFIAIDKEDRVIMGITEGGFFSLGRLGRFFDANKEFGLKEAMVLDGGPPACLCVKTHVFDYVRYGDWEVNEFTNHHESEYTDGWNPGNAGRWKIPTVIAINRKK